MKKLVDTWFCGWFCLFYDDSFSYYAFFTTILAEISFLWAFLPHIALPFTILLSICILNVCFCAWIAPRTRNPFMSCIIYSGTFLAVLISGCFINVLASILLVILPFVFTIFWSFLKIFQVIIMTFCPLVIFTIFLALSPISLLLKILIPLIYLLIMPFISYMEDDFATKSIFELFFPYD